MTESSRLATVNERVGVWWGLLTKCGVLLLGTIIGGVIVWEIVRQCRYDGIALEPAVVKVPTAANAPTAEMATQQIAMYIALIQQTGAREWRAHELAEGERASFNIQIPGSSLSVENVVREVAELFPQKRKVIKTSITANPSGAGYSGAVVVSGAGTPTRATCKTDEGPDPVGRMFECLAVEAMKAIEPLFAASYVLSEEEKHCAKFKLGELPLLPSANPMVADKQLLDRLREHCGFKATRALVSAIIERAKTDDQPWVSYIYGKLHLARADAVAKFDKDAEWYEFDRAIRRFETIEREKQEKLPASALAIQMEAYIKSGLWIQDTVLARRGDTSEEFVRYRLKKAEKVLEEAERRLERVAMLRRKENLERHQNAAIVGAAEASTIDEDRVDAMISHLRGLVRYRQWMIEARMRDRETPFSFAEGDTEKSHIKEVLRFFEAADQKRMQSYWLFMDWGNALRAVRDFDGAITKYRRAGDISPHESAPLLNIAISLLEKSKGGGVNAAMEDHFEAVRQTASYLTWASEGGPFDNLVERIADTLKTARGVELASFDACREKYRMFEADPRMPDMSHTAALRRCVDQARNSLAERLVDQK